MSVTSPWYRILTIAGLAAMLVGAIDPLEGSLVILPGTVLVALAGVLGGSRRKRLLVAGLVLVAAGVGALWLVSALGGIGGESGRSPLWGLALVPYPIGWILAIAGAVLGLVESYRRSTPVGQVVV